MAWTGTITVGSGADVAITTHDQACDSVVVTEDPGVVGWPTSDFLIKKGTAVGYVRVQAGQTYEFKSGPSFYPPNTIVGWMKMVSGTTTIDQDENTP